MLLIFYSSRVNVLCVGIEFIYIDQKKIKKKIVYQNCEVIISVFCRLKLYGALLFKYYTRTPGLLPRLDSPPSLNPTVRTIAALGLDSEKLMRYHSRHLFQTINSTKMYILRRILTKRHR